MIPSDAPSGIPATRLRDAVSTLWRRVLRSGLTALSVLLTVHPVRSEVLIPKASEWRWRPGTTEASTPIDAWRQPGFIDMEFTSAPSPFWYGDTLPGGTQISGMQNVYGCLFLRHAFTVRSLEEFGGLEMEALVDDGFVAWINGVEVLRVGVPGNPGDAVTIATLSANAAEPVLSTRYPVPLPQDLLKPGGNLLAVQVFQSSLGSSDLGFEASLESIVRDTVAPRVTSIEPAPGSTLTTLTSVTVTFSEPVTGAVAANLQIQGIGAATVTSPDPTRLSFTFIQPPYGSVDLRWDPKMLLSDLATPPNPFAPDGSSVGGTGWSYPLVDRTPPVVEATQPSVGTTVRALESASVLFSEPVTGVRAQDLLVNGSPAGVVESISPGQYLFRFPQPSPGLVTFSWAADQDIEDMAAPANPFSSGSWTVRLDPDARDNPPYLSEFMASNTRTLKDETGQYVDWIELHNPSDASVDLRDWSLTDDAKDLRKWRFPSTHLPPRGFLVVFASGSDRRVPGTRLHTGFQLSANGEYLALVRPDGVTIASEWKPGYPVQVPDVSFGIVQTPAGTGWDTGPANVYFIKPTPGTPNEGGTAVPGPVIEGLGHTPKVPKDSDSLTVTTRIRRSFQPVSTVTLWYRILFANEAQVEMVDDGAHGDGGAGDGVYGAILPADLAAPGQLIRYRVVATDTAGNASRWPLFTSPTATPEYQGTVVEPLDATTRLPVFHLFVAPGQVSRIDTESGGRISLFHDGELYDNVYMELRGNTSAGLAKKSHRLEFNRGHEFRHPGPGGPVRKSALLAEYLDPSYLRQNLCFWLLDQIGVPSPFHYPVRVQMNGNFYQLAFHNDVIGQEQIDRMGYDPRGALYKAVGTVTPDFYSTGVFQKLEPDGDASRTDYLQLANGIHESKSEAVRRATVFDLLDVPQVINHLAGTRWCAENDDVWANMSLYRDTFGDGLWRNIPFDMNASWGQLYGGSNPLEATVDSSKSHPLYGGSSTGNPFNRLYDVIVRLPETRQMLLRRQRTLLDRFIQPPGTPFAERSIEQRIIAMTNLIGPEALLDRSKWGAAPWAPGTSFHVAVSDLFNQFIEPRRRHWAVTHCVTNTAKPIGIGNNNNAGIPISQPPDAVLEVVDLDFNPSSGNQLHEYLALTNRNEVALDISGWRLSGGVEFQFRPGTVVPARRSILVSPDVRQFRSRGTAPRGGQGVFVVGPYSGQLSARGETLTLKDDTGRTVSTHTYVGAPSPAQRFLRISELQFHPGAPANAAFPDEDYEFIEFTNLSPSEALDLRGIQITGAVDFQFGTGPITSLAPGGRMVIVANPTAFESRYGPGLPVAGAYLGRLDNGGERIRVLDPVGEEILDFRYADWFPEADGGGSSMEVVNVEGEPDGWGDKAQWRSSSTRDGTPGRSVAGSIVARRGQNSEVILRFVAAPNQRHVLQSAESLARGEWQTLLTVPPSASERIIEQVENPSLSARFFRVLSSAGP